VYLGLERDAAVVARAQQLLEHPTPSLRADDRNYLAQLAAVATANPDFCAHIPANQRVNQVAAPLRDWCFYTVAFDTQTSLKSVDIQLLEDLGCVRRIYRDAGGKSTTINRAVF
jgi:hypothetical protein